MDLVWLDKIRTYIYKTEIFWKTRTYCPRFILHNSYIYYRIEISQYENITVKYKIISELNALLLDIHKC